MSAFVTEIKLRQHTPIIHFQHDQVGATLRATELKPKLDRFIMRKLLWEHNGSFIEDHLLGQQFLAAAKTLKPEWLNMLVGNGNAKHVALNYKVQIQSTEQPERFLISSLPQGRRDDEYAALARVELNATYLKETQYFADNQFLNDADKIRNSRLGLLTKGPIGVRITSSNSQLISILEANYRSFFPCHNFGTRQSKGFGCFLPDRLTDEEVLAALKADPMVTGVFMRTYQGKAIEQLREIAREYSTLKRGKSHGGYVKSRLWDHLCRNSSVQWEKRRIKLHIRQHDRRLFDQLKYDRERVASNRIDECQNGDADGPSRYIRALLGLAEQFEFGKLYGNERVTVKIKDSLELVESEKEKAVKRFKSPIRYLITERSVFMVTQRLNPLLHTYQDGDGRSVSREFEFQVPEMRSNPSFRLRVPTNFDLVAFVENYATNYSHNQK